MTLCYRRLQHWFRIWFAAREGISIWRCCLTNIRILIIRDCLIFMMEITIPLKDCLYIETQPLWHHCLNQCVLMFNEVLLHIVRENKQTEEIALVTPTLVSFQESPSHCAKHSLMDSLLIGNKGSQIMVSVKGKLCYVKTESAGVMSYCASLFLSFVIEIGTWMSNHFPTKNWIYRQTSNIRHALVDDKIVDHSDVVGASPVGAAPTTSSLST